MVELMGLKNKTHLNPCYGIDFNNRRCFREKEFEEQRIKTMTLRSCGRFETPSKLESENWESPTQQ